MGFNDDGLGAATAESANREAANRAEASAKDLLAMVEWLDARVKQLEQALSLAAQDLPELPSQKKAREHQEYMAREAALRKDRYNYYARAFGWVEK